MTRSSLGLKPFLRYYGGKWRAAPRYPAPTHRTIVEPFAGAAGYACRYPDRDVILVDKYPTICEVWRYLISAPSAEIRRIPTVDDVDDLPSWVPQGARWLVGFSMNSACAYPGRTLSAGRRRARVESSSTVEGWSVALRERVASQVGRIRHWRVIEGDYTQAPDAPATWYVDPPYNNRAGTYYPHGSDRIDYAALGAWCQSRQGQVIVCENAGAAWLPFTPFGVFKPGINNTTGGSREVIWLGC